MVSSSITIATFGFFTGGQADIPVHCLSTDIAGNWNILLGPTSGSPEQCGHRRPDVPKASAQPTQLFFRPSSDSSEQVVPDTDPYVTSIRVAMDTDRTNVATITSITPSGGHPTDVHLAGNYTMLYDEGFELRVPHPAGGRMVMFAFSKFGSKSTTKHPVSYCNEVFTGSFKVVKRDGAISYGCWKGKNIEKTARKLLSQSDNRNDGQDNFHMLDTDEKLQAQDFKTVAAHLNNVLPEGTWKAAAYPRFYNMSLRELNSMAGSRFSSANEHHHHSHGSSLLRADHHFKQHPRHHNRQHFERSGLSPANFPQKYEVARTFLGHVGDQGNCGSCYSHSTVSMLTARARQAGLINSTDAFSISWPLACSEYNQGCEGGYPYLIMKWLDEHGVLMENELNYKSNLNKNCNEVISQLAYALPKTNRVALKTRTAEVLPKSGRQFRVATYGYVGGLYGRTSHDAMMHELYTNGPLAIAYQVPDVFMWYSKGVFGAQASNSPVPSAVSILHELRLRRSMMMHSSLKRRKTDAELLAGYKPANDVASYCGQPPSRDAPKWYKVDHAVMLMGFGEAHGTRYWKIQNSWGSSWGENGFFRIVRGMNFCGIESDAVYGSIELA